QPFRAAFGDMGSVYRLSSERTASRGSLCLLVQYAFHGSAFSFARRREPVVIVKRSGVRAVESSVHASGTETGASGFARVENAATGRLHNRVEIGRRQQWTDERCRRDDRRPADVLAGIQIDDDAIRLFVAGAP